MKLFPRRSNVMATRKLWNGSRRRVQFQNFTNSQTWLSGNKSNTATRTQLRSRYRGNLIRDFGRITISSFFEAPAVLRNLQKRLSANGTRMERRPKIQFRSRYRDNLIRWMLGGAFRFPTISSILGGNFESKQSPVCWQYLQLLRNLQKYLR